MEYYCFAPRCGRKISVMLVRLWLVISIIWSCAIGTLMSPEPLPFEVALFVFPWIAGPIAYRAGRFIFTGQF